MTALTNLSQNAVVPTAGIADQSVTSRKQFLDVQWDQGEIAQYKASITATYVLKNNADDLAIAYGTDVDCWWEITANMGLLAQRTNAVSDSYFYMGIVVSPAPLVTNVLYSIASHVADNGPFGAASAKAIFALEANENYEAKLQASHTNAWDYYQDAPRLNITGKAWAR